MLNSEQIIEIVQDAVFERSLDDSAFDDISIDENYEVEFIPPEYSKTISLHGEVEMIISEWYGYGEFGVVLSLKLSNMACLADSETFKKELSLSLDDYSKSYHLSVISNRMSCINRMSEDELDKIKNSDEFTIKFSSVFPYYELVSVV